MTQNIIALIIVVAAGLITVYSLYKSLSTKEKSLCGGCASCDLKRELKKKGKLVSYSENLHRRKDKFTADSLKYSLKD
jgi:superfamily II helicase